VFSYLSHIPFLRPLLAFGLGIRCCDLFPHAKLVYWVLLCASLFVLVCLQRYLWRFRELVWGSIWLLFFFSAGFIYASLFFIQPQGQLKVSEQPQPYLLKLLSMPQHKSSGMRIHAAVYAYNDPAFYPAQGYFYIRSGSGQYPVLNDGDLLQAYFSPALFRPPANRYEFDLRRYYGRRGIWYTGFIKPEACKHIGSAPSFSSILRHFLVKRLRKAFNDAEEADVAAALVFGYEDDIDATTRSAFQRSGITHVLAVSGLHVSIIWWILSKLLFFLDGRKWKKLLRMFLVLAALWVYAAVTDFSPSILRSVVMFSFLMWAAYRNKGHNSWNILFVSAFCILLLSPSYLFDAGFWLSYLAVGGIMYFVPRWQRYTAALHPFPRSLADLLIVTIAAQLATLFYTLHVFGTFPNWFLLNNMIAVPLSSVALFTGLAYTLLADVPWLSESVGLLAELSTRLMIESAYFFGKLPYSYTQHIAFGLPQCLLCYLLLFMLCVFAQNRRLRYLYVSGALLCILILLAGISRQQVSRQHMLVMYALRNAAYVEYVAGRSSFVLYRSGLSESAYGFSVVPLHRIRQIPENKIILLPAAVWKPGNIRMYFMEKTSLPVPRSEVWHICTGENPGSCIRSAAYKPLLIVLHGICSKRSSEAWKREAQQAGIPVYVLAEQGMCIWYRD